jgi:hypothetical protein
VNESAIHGSKRRMTRGVTGGMRGEIEVETVRPRVHQRDEPARAARVLRLQRVGVDEQPHAQVLPDRAFTIRLRRAGPSAVA